MTFLDSIKWSTITETLIKIVSPISFLILAYFLKPDDFGIVAVATMFIAFCEIFSLSGFSQALIQTEEETDDICNSIFWINLLIGLFLFLCLFFLAPKLNDFFFDDIRIVNVIKVLSFQLIIVSLYSVPMSLLQKRMEFKKLFYVRLPISVSPIFISIPLAIYGFSYWSLIISTLVSHSLLLMIYYIYSEWKPKIRINFYKNFKLYKFALWITVNGLLTWFFVWFDTFLIAKYLSTYELGLYRIANQIVIIFFVVIFTPLSPVFFSYFSKIQKETEKLNKLFTNLVSVISYISIPIGIIIFMNSSLIENIFFNKNWAGIGFLISVFAIRNCFSWLSYINPEYYKSINRPYIETLSLTICALLQFPVSFYLIQIDFESFMIGRLILIFPLTVIHFSILFYFTKIFIFKKIISIAVIFTLSLSLSFLIYELTSKFINIQILVLFLNSFIFLLFIIGFYLKFGTFRFIKNIILEKN